MPRIRRAGRASSALALVGLSLAFATVTIAGCGKDRDPSRIIASGNVDATEVRVSTEVGGRILSFPVKEGDHVSEGQLLAQIDTVDARLSYEAALGERELAEAELRLRISGTRREEIAEAQAALRQAEADLEGATKDFERMQALLDARSGTTKARDDAATRRDVAAGRRDAARQRLARLRAGSRPEEIAAARGRLASAAARAAKLSEDLADTRVTSPVDGVVTEKLVEEGELVLPGTPVALVTHLAAPWLTVYVGEPDLSRIRIGSEAEVVTDDGQSRKGSVTFIASEAEFTPRNVQTRDERVKLVYRVKIGLDNTDGLFKPGMPAEARIQAEERAGEGKRP